MNWEEIVTSFSSAECKNRLWEKNSSDKTIQILMKSLSSSEVSVNSKLLILKTLEENIFELVNVGRIEQIIIELLHSCHELSTYSDLKKAAQQSLLISQVSLSPDHLHPNHP